MTCRGSQALSWLFADVVFALALTVVRADSEALWLTDYAKLVHKVKTLVIGDVDLKDATLKQVFDFLGRQSRRSDPEHQGINFVFLSENRSEVKALKFSVKLKHATVEDVLGQIPMLHVTIGDFIVGLRFGGEDGLYSRTFSVPDNLLAINDSMILDRIQNTCDARSLFEAKGIRFPPGTSAVYSLRAKSLAVTSSDPEQIIRVDECSIFGFKGGK
jgi:hypothetical protein